MMMLMTIVHFPPSFGTDPFVILTNNDQSFSNKMRYCLLNHEIPLSKYGYGKKPKLFFQMLDAPKMSWMDGEQVNNLTFLRYTDGHKFKIVLILVLKSDVHYGIC